MQRTNGLQWTGLAAGISVLFWVCTGFAADVNKGAEKMELYGGKKGKIPFSHHLHQERLVDCNTCHTLFPQVAGSIEKMKSEGKLKKKQVMNTLCIKCHKSLKKAQKDHGPVTCSKCHLKK
jgi:hypothetical protein